MNTNLISLSHGAAMTALYRTEKENILVPEYQNTAILPICESFNRDVFDSLLSYENCVGIRIYWGMDDNLNVKVIICGVNAQGDNVYLADDSGILKVIENGVRCPDECPPKSALNS